MTSETKPELQESVVPSAVATILPAKSRESVGADQKTKLRAIGSAAGMLGGCVLWFFALFKFGVTTEALPWFITIGLIAAFGANQAARTAFNDTDLEFSSSQSKEPLSLLESWTISYLAAAVLLFIWVSVDAVLPKETRPKVVQFVDIQLDSLTDFEDRDSPLPGTEVKEELHKRVSDQTTQQGSLTSSKVAPVARRSNERATTPAEESTTHNQETPKDAPKAEPDHQPKQAIIFSKVGTAFAQAQGQPEAQQEMVLMKPITPASDKTSKQVSGKSQVQQPYLEEVQPPELVELIENDGNINSTSLSQAGGQSAGGKGAPSELNTYIKELHQRIKHIWSPPRGQTRRAQVLFRVKSDGKLALLKLVASSGDNETDEAALKAITGAVSRHPLPAGYALPYLDVQYSFNYTVDEIKEVKAAIHPY